MGAKSVTGRPHAATDSAALQARLLELEHAERVQRALYTIADVSASQLPLPDMLARLHQTVAGLMHARNFFIALCSPCGQKLQYIYYADTVDADVPHPDEWVEVATLEHGITWHVIHDRRPMMAHAIAPEHQPSHPVRAHGAPALDWLAVPMLEGERVRGAIVVQCYEAAQRYRVEDMHLLAFVADHILAAIERRQDRNALQAQVEARTRELADLNRTLREEVAERQRSEHLQRVLYRISALTSNDADEAGFYGSLHAAVGSLIKADNFYIAVVDDCGRNVRFAYVVDEVDSQWAPRPLGKGLTEYVMEHGRTLLLDAPGMQALVDRGDLDADNVGAPAASWLGAPLFGPDGAIGVIAVQTYDTRGAYTDSDAELLTYLARQISSTLHRRIAADRLIQANAELEQRVAERTRDLQEEVAARTAIEQRLQHEVVHDPLTGLPNRVYLRDRIERLITALARNPDAGFALLYLDVDRFKLVNDTLGHLAGDDVLRSIATRIQQAMRGEDIVARIAGDEFAVLLESAHRPLDATRVAQRILDALQSPLDVAGRQLTVTSSIGIAMVGGRYRSTDAVFHDADKALYRAKHAGRNRIVLFDEAMQRDAMDVLAMEQALRDGLRRHEFVPWFQPIVDMTTRKVCAYEALLRWQHPQRGVLGPGDFLGVAEDSGLIEDIDWQMFRVSLQHAHQLPEVDCCISLNVSPRLFARGDFERDLLTLLEDTAFDPARLKIEITERSLLIDPEHVAGSLLRLREAGVQTYLDDFGAGYSSLSHVHHFPLQGIKIDRGFIAPLARSEGTRTRAIVETLLALGRALGMSVVAEGVEEQAQHAVLLAQGCPLGQGWLYGRPHPASHWQALAAQ